jgi:kynureninase
VIEQWSGDLISSWWEHDWLNLALTVGDELAPLLGAGTGEVAVHESTTVGIFQQVNVALDLSLDLAGDHGRRRVIAVADDDFPTDRYVVEGIAQLRDVDVRRGLDDLDGVDVVLRSLVDYRTAEVTDLVGETERARRQAPSRCGICPMPPVCSNSTSSAPASISRSAAPTSSSTAGRVHRRSSSWRSGSTIG